MSAWPAPHSPTAPTLTPANFFCRTRETFPQALCRRTNSALVPTLLRRGNMKKAIMAALTVLTMALVTNAYAHSGGTDSNGCHTNHKTGEYHCH
ncbi:YHYH domain-containing protein [Mesorhizobium sp. M0091]|uniref:YHYH domain-containing protein n=1 Tax=Mesorhizobium sp. M0091 TaxID=2956875 RepID=UPI00333C31AC